MTHSEQGSVEKVAELVADVRIAMVTSVAADGRLVARPLSVQDTEFDGDLWFFVDRAADLLDQIRVQPAVNVALVGKGSWVSVAGTASVVEDPARAAALWNPVTAAWFNAEGSVDAEGGDPGPAELGAVLVKVDGDTAEYWDSPGKVATVLSLVRAQAGRASTRTENEVVDLP